MRTSRCTVHTDYTCVCASLTLSATPSRCHWLTVEPNWDFHCGLQPADSLSVFAHQPHTLGESVEMCTDVVTSQTTTSVGDNKGLQYEAVCKADGNYAT